jgi:hypothetical protein
MKKMFISIALICLSISLFAQNEDDFSIIQNKSGFITIIGYNNRTIKSVTIPATISGIKVTVIGNKVFYLKGLTSVVIPNTITRIEGEAFYSYSFATSSNNTFTEIVIPDSVKEIADDTFAGCNLASITMGSNVSFFSYTKSDYKERKRNNKDTGKI